MRWSLPVRRSIAHARSVFVCLSATHARAGGAAAWGTTGSHY
jgi:hypothetical protein